MLQYGLKWGIINTSEEDLSGAQGSKIKVNDPVCALLIKLCARQYFYFRGTPHLKSQKKDGLKFKKDTKVSGSVGSTTKKIRQ